MPGKRYENMIDPGDLKRHVIGPALEKIGLSSRAAVNLLLATAIVESTAGKFQYLKQRGGGPALGIFQIEPATHGDIWKNFLRYRLSLYNVILQVSASYFYKRLPPDHELVWNLAYATAIARLVYYRSPLPLPEADDLPALGAYWKRVYNTADGKGTVDHFLDQVEPHRAVFAANI